MGTPVSLIDDLESAIHSGSAEKRADMLRSVTDLFLGDVERFDNDQVDLFGDVFNRLIEQVEGRALPEFSQRIAPVEKAPQAVVRKLAYNDDIDVAGPVLSQSPQLTDEVLVDIAAKKGQGHLGAISGRSRIAPVVTDVLVRRGDAAVVQKLTRNQGASFSQNGFGVLTKRAEMDAQLAECIASRSDVPADMVSQVLAKLTDAERERLTSLLAQAGKKSEPRQTRDFRSAEALIDRMQLAGELKELSIYDFAVAQRFEEVTVGLARLCAAPVALVDRLMQNPRYDGVLIACKACGLHWPTFKAVLAARPGFSANATELERAKTDFLKLTAATAQRMFRFWLVRGVP